MRVDAHLHVWRAVSTDQSVAPTVVSGHTDVPIELALAYMDEHGIDRAVLVQPLYPGEDNSYVADAAAAQPERFAAVCVVDPRQPEADARLADWVQKRGCRGVRLRPRVPEESTVFGAASTYGLWSCAQRLKVVVSVLAGAAHLATLDGLARRFGDTDIVIDHMAHPDVAGGVTSPAFRSLLALAQHPRIHVKISGFYHFTDQPYPYESAWDMVRAAYERFGPDRLIWGSDFPHVLLRTGYRRALFLAERHLSFFSATDRAKFLGGNAERLYWPESGS